MKAVLVALVAISALLFSGQVYAVSLTRACSGTGVARNTPVCSDINNQAGKSQDPVIHTLGIAISVLGYVIGVAAVIVLIIAGLRMVVGGSNPQDVANARNTIIYAIVGIVIAVLAESLVVFILDKLK